MKRLLNNRNAVVPTFGDRITYKLGNVGQTYANAITREIDWQEQEAA